MRERTPEPASSPGARFQMVEELFHRARELAPADRATFLDEACAEDLVMRRDVESLLLHSEQATADVQIPRPEEGERLTDRGPVTEGPGTHIGPYKILQQIGEGGFGVVYMAEQEHPVRRKVAVKIIKLGMDTKQVIARFEAERQALALMDHPNIAKVLDAGATETGRPYFVMELVRGIPITQYCDEQRLSTRQRLGLFQKVCNAISHAHQKGIIHRDIKPSNVLVTLHDDIPVPKVIDFGIAKATSSRLTEKTLFTEFRQFIGTPEYMSPDQADISGLDIDTRTDIYSLGVLLYELLTGTTPLDAKTLRGGGYADIQRIIREAEPPLPSTRVNALGRRASTGPTHKGEAPASPSSAVEGATTESLKDIASHRRIEPSGLSRMLRGDLDWIVMKAMEKDRTRRYQTANELAADITRHLNNEAVLAGPPSAVYAMRKFIRRHKVGVTVTLLMAAALIVGLSVASIGFVRASQEAAHSRAVSDFLQTVIIDVEHSEGELSSDEVVERGRALFGNDHAIVGNLLSTRASTLAVSGRLDEGIAAQREALAFLEEAHGEHHPSVAAAMTKLGEYLEERRDIKESEELYRRALDLKQELFDEDSTEVAEATESLTSLLVETGSLQHDEIKALWRRAVDAYSAALGPTAPTTVKQLCEMSCWMMNNGYTDEAAQVLPLAVERARAVLHEDDIIRFLTVNAYASSFLLKGDYSNGLPLIEELRDLAAKIWKEDRTMEIMIRTQLVMLHRYAGDTVAAEEALENLIAARRASESKPHFLTFQFAQGILSSMDDWFEEHPEEGRFFANRLASDARLVTQPGTEPRADALSLAGRWLSSEDYFEDASRVLGEAVAAYRACDPKNENQREEIETSLATALAYYCEALTETGRYAMAESAARECISIRARVLDPQDQWLATNARSLLGAAIAGQGRFEEAESILLEADTKLRSSILVPADNQRRSRERLVALYEAWGKPARAAEFREGEAAPEDSDAEVRP